MLYLMLFTVLSIGFYAASSLSVQIAKNDRAIAEAQSAAESGLQFVRYHLGAVEVASNTPDENLGSVIANSLGEALDGSVNMNGHTVTIIDNVINLPGAGGFITIDASSGSKFQAQICAIGPELSVKVIGCGRDGSISRTVQLRFSQAAYAGGIRFVPIANTYEEVTQ